MPFDFSCSGVDRHRRCNVEIVAGAPVTNPGTAVASPNENEIRLRVIVRGYPDGPTAVLPLIAVRPRFTSRFSGRWDRERAPQFFSEFRIDRRDEASNTELTAR